MELGLVFFLGESPEIWVFCVESPGFGISWVESPGIGIFWVESPKILVGFFFLDECPGIVTFLGDKCHEIGFFGLNLSDLGFFLGINPWIWGFLGFFWG